MTLEDLEVIRFDAYWAEYDKCPDIDQPEKHVRANRAALRAVVKALWDKMEFCNGPCNTCGPYRAVYNEILDALPTKAKAKVDARVKAASQVAQVVEPLEVREVAGASPALPAADSCEWTAVHLPDRLPEFETQCGAYYVRVRPSPSEQGTHHCYSCGRPIKFKSEAAQ